MFYTPIQATPTYASGVFDNTYFDSSIVNGNTDLTVRFHLPPGVQPQEPRWHTAPAGFPDTPESYLDNNGQVTYVWQNSNARADRAYEFGASFPAKYIPAAAITRPSATERLGISADSFTGFGCCVGFFAIFAFFTALGVYNGQKRKLQYLPPKVAIEGHGIKRGLTAPEAAILMEQPMDKVLSMILFAVIKKNAASVVTRDPLKLNITDPQPEDLRDYEKDFLEAYKTEDTHPRRLALQTATINLVNSVSAKMKGFSRKETIEYYRSIVASAWKQVEDADTPQVKSERYDEVMEWTMLDDDYDRRTRDVFRQGPVYTPIWWGRFDPSFGRSTPSASVPSAPGGSISLPQLPGSDFAASVVNGVQNMAAGAIGSVTDFTSGVTNKTNPVPVSTSSGYRGGSGRSGGCACACACAGCACACAGGGR